MMRRLVVTGLLALGGWLGLESSAMAQEIQLTGPLAGAPAVRNLRWHRKNRIEIAPTISFTLLDEFQRTILAGGRLNYNITDWLAIGAWGAYGAVHSNMGLTDEIDRVNKNRWKRSESDPELAAKAETDRNASLLSVGKNFPSQLGSIQWVVAPQITAVPFRGKLAIFKKVFVDTDVYVFGGAAFIGLKERANFDPSKESDAKKFNTAPCQAPLEGQDCATQIKYETASRMAVAPTFGLGMTLYTGKWTGLGLEYRALPFAWNNSGFDSRGGAPGDKGPDYKVDEKDRVFRFNQMISVSFNIYLPTSMKVSP